MPLPCPPGDATNKFTSPNEALLFFTHHANLDRLFMAWQVSRNRKRQRKEGYAQIHGLRQLPPLNRELGVSTTMAWQVGKKGRGRKRKNE